ncbi:MAG: SusC/RagA family TonB-linked outer membrane protein [Saprospiraceae bacterium]
MRIKINNLLSKCLLLALMLSISSYAMAQRTITGTVTDDRGDGVISVTVQVDGTTIGTTTDLDGKYSINVPEGSTALKFSYIGYATKTVELGASNVVDVVMGEDAAILEEIVVVGYGTTTRKEVTSAVTSVKSEDFNQGNVQDPVQLVQGKVAGLAISKPGGDPNASSSIRLRGLSTIGANTEPLIVIDGVIGGSLGSVDPNDIESIDVLKDGSAAAIYGTRASSGVILITTKKGRAGKSVVEYNGYVTTESVDRTVQSTTASEFVALRPGSKVSESSTNWIDEVTRTGLQHVHNVSLSGGSGSTTYRAAFNYRDIQGIGIGSGFNQLNGRLNLTQKALDDRLTLNVNVSATNRKNSYMPYEAFRYANVYNPTAPVFFDETNPDYLTFGGYYQSPNFDYFNPRAIADQTINDGEIKTVLITGKATYEIMDGLSASAFVSSQKDSRLFGEYYAKEAYFRGTDEDGFASRFTEDVSNDLFEATLNYKKAFGKLDFGALVGYSYQENTYENFGASGGGFIFNANTYNNLGAAADFADGLGSVFTSKNSDRIIGGFARLNFNYDDVYYGMVSYRREGSSRFGANNKWGGFPAISAGVNLAKITDIPSVDLLKLRVGYGETGGLPPQSYLALQQYNVSAVSFGASGDLNANPNLRWETKGEFNAGVDFALMDYKFTGSVDYYNRLTRDLIYNVVAPTPPYLAPRIWANLQDVELQSTGVEFVLSYNYEKDDFSWSPTVTFGSAKSILNTVDNPDAVFKFFQSEEAINLDAKTSPGAPGQNDAAAGVVLGNQEVGQLWGYKFVEFDEAGEYVYEAPDGSRFTSLDADPDNKQVIGNGMPSFNYGITNAFRYKDFDFSFFLRGDYGHDLANMYRAFYEGVNARSIDNIVNTEYFTEDLKATPRFNSYYVEDASYMVLDNLTFGYTLRPGEGSSVSKVRLYLTGRNLFWITNYTGVDPQPRFSDSGATDNGGTAGTADPLYAGFDRRNTYFTTRSLTFGLNLSF